MKLNYRLVKLKNGKFSIQLMKKILGIEFWYYPKFYKTCDDATWDEKYVDENENILLKRILTQHKRRPESFYEIFKHPEIIER